MGFAFIVAFSPFAAMSVEAIAPRTSFIWATMFGSPPIFWNAIATASVVRVPVKIAAYVSDSEITSHIPFKSPATSAATGANAPPAASAKSPQALAHCFNFPAEVCAKSFA